MPYYTAIVYDYGKGKNLLKVKDSNGALKINCAYHPGLYYVDIEGYVYKETHENRKYLGFMSIEEARFDIKEFDDDETALFWFMLNYGV